MIIIIFWPIFNTSSLLLSNSLKSFLEESIRLNFFFKNLNGFLQQIWKRIGFWKILPIKHLAVSLVSVLYSLSSWSSTTHLLAVKNLLSVSRGWWFLCQFFSFFDHRVASPMYESSLEIVYGCPRKCKADVWLCP